MSYFTKIIVAGALAMSLVACNGQKNASDPATQNADPDAVKMVKEKVASFAETEISADMSNLDENEKQIVKLLCQAANLADQIFWTQVSTEGRRDLDSLNALGTPYAKDLAKLVAIHYGPFDVLNNNMRFVGKGTPDKNINATYYPADMTAEEFEKYVKAHPEQKAELESQYTVVKREGNKLVAVPFYKAYPEIEQICKLLEQAATYAKEPALKKYLLSRAKAFRSDNYFQSDMDWMSLTTGNIELVIGPIENYLDGLFNYKTAWECGVFVKDKKGSEELSKLNAHIDELEHNLPYDKKYIRESAGGSTTILSVVNVVAFAGDFNQGSKTVATSLPNDPKVHDLKGAKKLMFKNMMEAKFEKIVLPIAKELMNDEDYKCVSKDAFTNSVILHEVSHTLGRGFVYGNDKLAVRTAMKDLYSTIEESKADVLGMFNHEYLVKIGYFPKDYLRTATTTYLAGLFRSMRFGQGEAHGGANFIQFNFLRQNGAIKLENGKYKIVQDKFMTTIRQLARQLLTIEATGDYAGAKKLIEKYSVVTPELTKAFENIKIVPTDLYCKYKDL